MIHWRPPPLFSRSTPCDILFASRAVPLLYRDRPRPQQRPCHSRKRADERPHPRARRRGRLGYVAAEAFRDAGWQVKGLVRPGRAGAVPRRVEPVEAVTRDEAVAAASGCDVVLNALNPAITEWRKNALSLAYAAIAAAESNGATLLFPGSVWNYGRGMPPVLDESTPMQPTTRKGAHARRDRAAHPRGLRPRHAGDHPARRRFLRRRQRLLVRSGDRQGHRAQPPHLSRPARRRARLGLSARFRGDAGAARRAARELRRLARHSDFPAMR